MERTSTDSVERLSVRAAETPKATKKGKMSEGGKRVEVVKDEFGAKQLVGVKTHSVKGGWLTFLAGGVTTEKAQKRMERKGMVVVKLGDRNRAVAVKASDLAKKLNVHTSIVKQAGRNNAVRALIDDVGEISQEQVAKLRKETKLSKRDATALSVVIGELQSKGTILGKKLEVAEGGSLKPYARRKQFKIPLSIQQGEGSDVFVHSKEHGVKRLGKAGFGKATKSVRVASKGAVPEKVVQKSQRGELKQFWGLVKKPGAGPAEQANLMRVQGLKYVVKVHEAGEYAGKKIKTVKEVGPGGKSVKVKKAEAKHGIVLEYCDGGSLNRSKLKKMPESERWELFAKVLEGAQGIHDAGLVHRDYKAQNILLKTNEEGKLAPRIVDFGIAVDTGTYVDGAGTLPFIAPEGFDLGEPAKPSLDVWSLGAVGLKEFAGIRPPIGLLVGMGVRDVDKLNWKKIENEEVQFVLKGMMKPDADERMSLGEAIERLRLAIPKMQAAEAAAAEAAANKKRKKH